MMLHYHIWITYNSYKRKTVATLRLRSGQSPPQRKSGKLSSLRSEGSVAILAGRAQAERARFFAKGKKSETEDRAKKSTLGIFVRPCEDCYKPERLAEAGM